MIAVAAYVSEAIVAFKTPPDAVTGPIITMLGWFLFIIATIGTTVFMWAGAWLWAEQNGWVSMDPKAQHRRFLAAAVGGIFAVIAAPLAWQVLA